MSAENQQLTPEEASKAIDLAETVLRAANGSRFCVVAEVMTQLTAFYMGAVAKSGGNPHEAAEQLHNAVLRFAGVLHRRGMN